jgi:hypothetical protein
MWPLGDGQTFGWLAMVDRHPSVPGRIELIRVSEYQPRCRDLNQVKVRSTASASGTGW